MAANESKTRILMLHGFTQTGPTFQVKTRKLLNILRPSLSYQLGIDPEDIEFVFPTAPHKLQVGPGADIFAPHETSNSDDDQLSAWWLNLDADYKYIGLEQSLLALRTLCQTQGPFYGVIGFSLGATFAAMFTSWCESSVDPRRQAAMADMARINPELASIITSPPQDRPLGFALCFSGYRATMAYYSGFYEPAIQTPTVHVFGKLDTLIQKSDSLDLAGMCKNPTWFEHQGVHFVPTNVDFLHRVVEQLVHALDNTTPPLDISNGQQFMTRSPYCYSNKFAAGMVASQVLDFGSPFPSPPNSTTSDDTETTSGSTERSQRYRRRVIVRRSYFFRG